MPRASKLQAGCYLARLVLVAIPAMAVASPAMARIGIDLSAGAAVAMEYDSNPLQLSRGEPLPSGAGDGTQRDDTALRLTANLGAAFILGPITLQLTSEFSHVESNRFGNLTRNDVNVGGNLLWNSKQNQVWDLSLQMTTTSLPVGLADIGGDEATQTKTREVKATVRVRPTPRWQVGITPGYNESKTPLPDEPDFKSRGTTAKLSLEYLGGTQLVPGVAVNGGWTKYSGTEQDARYRERGIQATLNYKATGLSTFDFSGGYTQHIDRIVDAPNGQNPATRKNTTSALTGLLNYRRRISVKTDFNVSAFRYFQQYDAGTNTSVSTGFSGAVGWAATRKLSVSLSTSFAWSDIEDLPVNGAFTVRKDLVRSTSLTASYALMRRFSLRGYATRDVRASSIGSDQFNDTHAGVELSVRFD